MGPAGAGGCRDFSSASGRRLQTLVVDIVDMLVIFGGGGLHMMLVG